MISKAIRIAVVGAGVGGLTLDLYLHKLGFKDVKIFEGASILREVGAGINIQANATQILQELGLLPEVAIEGVLTKELVFLNKFGQFIYKDYRGIFDGHKTPQVSIHRGFFHQILVNATRQRLGVDSIFTNHRLSQINQLSIGEVLCHFTSNDKTRDMAPYTADLVVGADGFNSKVREHFYPKNKDCTKWNGMKMWRGTSLGSPFLSGSSMVIVGNYDIRAVIYSIKNDNATSLINWVAEVRDTNSTLPSIENWNTEGSLDEFIEYFCEWQFPWLNIYELFKNTRLILKYPMADKDPIERWSFGNITLLGDAAHPMYPSGSNGASQAILDAKTLAIELNRDVYDIDRALKNYEDIRKNVINDVVLANRDFGAEKALQVVDNLAPQGFKNINDVITGQELKSYIDKYKGITGLNSESIVNQRND